jgi:subtilisin family serine protease
MNALTARGMRAPGGQPAVVYFDSLKIRTFYGQLSAGSVRRLAELPFVAMVESSEDVDSIVPHVARPTWTSSFARTMVSDITWNLTKVRVPDIWNVFGARGWRSTGPSSFISAGVAVLDDGLDYRMAQFVASPWEWYHQPTNVGNFTTNTTATYLGVHGTSVGGFIAAENNDLWVAGVAPRAWLKVYKVLPSTADWGSVVSGLNRVATNGNAVVNMSLGNCGQLPPTTMQNAVRALTTRVPADGANPGVGVSMVASAGNGTAGGCGNTVVSYPAAYAEVIAVSPININNAFPAGYSQGAKVELTAPGICVNGLAVGGGIRSCINGSSFAAPHVAGLIAAIRARNNSWSAATVRSRLQQYATKISGQALPRDNRFGYGLVNPYNVLANP